MASLESYGVDEYGNSNGVNLPDFTGCLLLATTPTPPAGTLVADGSEVSREAYAKLFAIFGESQGAGDGVTTFNLPDWRDEFPRFSGASRSVLTAQGDAIRQMIGTMHNIYCGDVQEPDGVFAATVGAVVNAATGGTATLTARSLIFNVSNGGYPTADENRPRNVAFLPCIIYE